LPKEALVESLGSEDCPHGDGIANSADFYAAILSLLVA
jgi:hypothetical protein